MHRIHSPAAFFLLIMLALTARAEPSAQPTAAWNFDEGSGDVAHDTSGNGHHAQLNSARWEAQAKGSALSLDGLNGSADCGDSTQLGIGGPLTIEAWIKPTRKPNGEMILFGEGYDTYVITFYNTELCLFYIGSGGNSVSGKLALHEWNHLVATFDGTNLAMWINGRQIAKRESKFQTYAPAGRFRIGTPGRPDLPKFKGAINDLRIYPRAISDLEILEHFRNEAPGYGFDAAWFNRVRVKPFYYFDRGEIVVDVDFQRLQPLSGSASLELLLSRKGAADQPIAHQTITSLPATGLLEQKFKAESLSEGDYVIHVSLKDDRQAWPTEEIGFAYPPKPSPLPSPATARVNPLPKSQTPASFAFKLFAGGGFEVALQGQTYKLQTRISWPNGKFNQLAATDAVDRNGEAVWQVTTSTPDANRCIVSASGAFYSVQREILVRESHVYVRDTYTNTTDAELGLLIYNETPLAADQVKQSLISGHERLGRQPELGFPEYGPTTFFADGKAALGLVPVDDVSVVQAIPYVSWEGAAGVGTERFALAGRASYTIEWAVYPTGTGDYYDFINAFRRAENRIGTVKQPPGFFTYGPNNRRQVPTKDFIEKRGMKIGIIHCMSQCADDPELSIEGMEFMDFPKEMQLLQDQASVIRKLHPDFKTVFHIAHSLYATNRPERFADSKVILPDGKQAIWGSDGDISRKRQDEGWQWWIFYPTPGNSFHDVLMRGADVVMDQLGFDGVFLDGFLAGYISQWTYDRWDGHSAEIDLETKTIKRKMGSVVLLSQPSMIEFTRKIRDKGGIAIANNTVFTRSICNEKHILFDNECASGPQLHLAPTLTVLAAPPLENEQELYRDMLDKLSWGELFLYYNERVNLDYPSLASKSFPITFEEIRSGMVRGPERIVTMKSGIYGWPDDRRLHLVTRFDSRGAISAHDFTTTIDAESVRTELKLTSDESAVIEPIPVRVAGNETVNSRVLAYDGASLQVMLNGRGAMTIELFVGTAFPDKRYGGPRDGGLNPASMGVGNDYRVTVNGKSHVVKEKDGVLSVPLDLNGQADVLIAPAN